jgi:hypothetical protein
VGVEVFVPALLNPLLNQCFGVVGCHSLGNVSTRGWGCPRG